MTNIINSKTIYIGQPSIKICYTLSERMTEVGTVYDIECKTLKSSEIYEGVTDKKDKAEKIFEKIVKGAVFPQHLICIIDELNE